MNKQKITFGKIQLNVKNCDANDPNASENNAEISGYYCIFCV